MLGSAWCMILCHHSRSVISVPERQVPWMWTHVSRDQPAGRLTKLRSIHYADRTAVQLTVDPVLRRRAALRVAHVSLHYTSQRYEHQAQEGQVSSSLTVPER
jgi:hypothetical protein